ncbi:hypothetical protein, partial [Halobellus captivus]|uniref:hypothetical protein n=1 Tax=Halobellus captivus TaxID=2592614 RepID=UPI001939D308
NPSRVLLKAAEFAERLAAELLQPIKGPSESCGNDCRRDSGLHCFNPSRVLLKVPCDSAWRSGFSHFNPSRVLLKDDFRFTILDRVS